MDPAELLHALDLLALRGKGRIPSSGVFGNSNPCFSHAFPAFSIRSFPNCIGTAKPAVTGVCVVALGAMANDPLNLVGVGGKFKKAGCGVGGNGAMKSLYWRKSKAGLKLEIPLRGGP